MVHAQLLKGIYIMNNAFITGSRIYGEPNNDSDIDVVIKLNITDTDKIIRVLTSAGQKVTENRGDYAGQTSIKIGALNLLVCHSDKTFFAWSTGTEMLKRERTIAGRPLSRERAIEVFSYLREKLGIKN